MSDVKALWYETLKIKPVECFVDDDSAEKGIIEGITIDIIEYRKGEEYPFISESSFIPDDLKGWRFAIPVDEDLRIQSKGTTSTDTRVEGDHYRKCKIQPIEYILANNIPFCEGNVIKYVTKWKSKGGIEDLNKAKHYIELLIELETNG